MAVTNGWGQAAKNNTNGFGKLATNTINEGAIYENSWSGDTALIGTSAAFAYGKSSFNQGEADPTPTITGTAGGSFNADAGVVFVDTGSFNSSTGQIDLSATTIDNHIITYTVDGVQSGQSVGVESAPYSSTSSFTFDGINDYFLINSSGTLNTFHQNPFSISFWFKTSTGGTMILSEKATSSSAASRAFYIYLSGGTIVWYGGTASPSYTNGSYNDGNWHHLACVAESNTVARIYIDGVDDTNNIAKDRIGSSSVNAPIILGTTYNQSGFFLNGLMDEVSIWNTALSSAAVTEIASGPSDLTSLTNASSSNLKAWYKMGE